MIDRPITKISVNNSKPPSNARSVKSERRSSVWRTPETVSATRNSPLPIIASSHSRRLSSSAAKTASRSTLLMALLAMLSEARPSRRARSIAASDDVGTSKNRAPLFSWERAARLLRLFAFANSVVTSNASTVSNAARVMSSIGVASASSPSSSPSAKSLSPASISACEAIAASSSAKKLNQAASRLRLASRASWRAWTEMTPSGVNPTRDLFAFEISMTSRAST